MSLTPSSSPYLSSSSSVETTLSSSSLSGSQSQSSSLDHSRKESWDEGDGSLLVRRTNHLPPSQQNDDDDLEEDWKGGVSLRKGWEFLDKGGGGAAYRKGGLGGNGRAGGGGGGGGGGKGGGGNESEEANRVSVAETVKPELSLADLPPSPSSWIIGKIGKSPSSSSSLAAGGESEDLIATLPAPPSFSTTTRRGSDDVQPPGSTSNSNSSSTTSLSLLGKNGVRPLPTPLTSSASSSTKGSIRPLPTPPSLLLVVDQTASSTSTSSSSIFPTPPSSNLQTEQPPSRQISAANTTTPTPTLVNDTASLSASTSTTASSSSSSSSSRSSTPPRPSTSATTSNLGPTHQRSFSAQPHLQPQPSSSSQPSLSISTASAPSLPLKPTWLQSKALPASPTSPGRRPSTAPTTLEVPSGGPNDPRPTHTHSHSTSHSNHLSIRRTNTPPSSSPLPLSPAPLLPPRPTPQVQKHVAKAEFAPSSLPSNPTATTTTRPTHAPSHSVSSSFGGGGMRNRLAAWGGMVGGVAGAVYSESNAYFNQPNEHAASSSSANGNGNGTGSSSKSPKPLHQVLFSAPGTAVRHLNSSWRASSSNTNGKPSNASSSNWGGARRVTMYDPNGPAGVLVAAGEGRVFGREVGEVVGEGWGLVGGTNGKKVGEGRLVNGKGREVLPALVVRCVDYLETWGPREEGIFRISGRATHVQKLRNQFDTGADIDLALSDPSDLDPHAVASVFKAYLRELPSAILTSTLTPSFDVVLRKYTGSPARDQGFGVSSVARPEGSLKGGEQRAALLKEVKDLLEKLPEVHWWLLKAVVCLLDHTSKFSHENKMTLSNLLLVFCPSLCLSPPFLRLLVENHTTLFDKSPADLNSNSTALLSNPPLLPPRPKVDNITNSPVVPPSTPTRKKMTIDPPRLDVRVPSTSPLPSFATLAKEESSSGSGQTSTGWESPAKKGGLKKKLGVPVASEGTGGASPSAWNGGTGSMRKKRNMSSPPRSTSSGSNNGDGTEEILVSSSSNTKDRASMFSSSRKNGSFVDLQASVPPPQSSLLFSSPPPPTSSTSSTRRASEETKPSPSPSSPATDAPPTDVLPPSGVVAARRHIFGTPISDRFKSTTTPTFHSFRRSGNSNNSPSPDPATASLPDLAVTSKPFHRGGGGFFGSSNHKVVPVVPVKSSEASGSASGKRGGMWKRGSAMVGLGGGGGHGGGLEEGLGRTVLDAVKALEGGGGNGGGSTRG